jgi:uncharacterized repeat protein (TIGR03803 family)
LVKGKLYGVAPSPGTGQPGTFYELIPPTAPGQLWTEETLYEFRTGSPGSTLAAGQNGAFYGILAAEGSSGRGGVFQLLPPSQPGVPYSYDLIYAFDSTECPGACTSTGPPTIDSAGNVYVAAHGVDTGGAVLEISPSGAGWSKSTLFTFTETGLAYLNGGMQIGAGGAIYGTAQMGGTANCGAVWAIYPPNSEGAVWTEATLHNFNPGSTGSDGCEPYGGLAQDSSGSLYGTTVDGGISTTGVVYQLIPAGNDPLQYTVIHYFAGPDGRGPEAPPVVGKGGVLYGTAVAGGYQTTGGLGAVYELTPPAQTGGTWTDTTLFDFDNGAEGSHPVPQLAISSSGTLYGIAVDGGSDGHGVAFSVVP